MPRVDDTLNTLAGSKWFSIFDMLSGYWQVEVNDKDREKTAFVRMRTYTNLKSCPLGCVMPLALPSALWTWSLPAPVEPMPSLDDIIVIGTCFDEHLENLRHVFHRFRGAGLKLKPAKCVFCARKVSFLGHIVSAEGISADPSKTEKVRSWPFPSSRREVQQFWVLRAIIRGLSKILCRLCDHYIV